MTQDFGDRAYGHGREVTRSNSSGSDFGAGEWVVPTGDDDVDLADVDASRGSLVAVTKDPIKDTEEGPVHMDGVVHARVESSVTANDELQAPDTSSGSSTAGVAESGGSSGIFALTDATDYTGNSEYACLVKLR